MTRLIAYDISHDRLRTKMADHLLAIGLLRVQKSVYLGKVKERSLQKFLNKYEPQMKEGDKLYVLNLHDSQVRTMYAFGLGEEMALILDEIRTMVV